VLKNVEAVQLRSLDRELEMTESGVEKKRRYELRALKRKEVPEMVHTTSEKSIRTSMIKNRNSFLSRSFSLATKQQPEVYELGEILFNFKEVSCGKGRFFGKRPMTINMYCSTSTSSPVLVLEKHSRIKNELVIHSGGEEKKALVK